MAAETQYTANTGFATITTANTSLTGSGTLNTDIWEVITGASNGTLIKTVTIKAQGNTTQGMVRIFVYDGSNTKLLEEVEIPAVTQSATDPAYEITIPLNYSLKSSWKLRVTTEKSETFNIIAEGLNWTYYASSVRPDSTKYTANTGMQTVSSANSALNGTGTLSSSIVTGASNGTQIQTIKIKATVTTTAGMIRLFLYDGSNTKLLMEVPVSSVVKSATVSSFSRRITFLGGGFALKSGWSIKASTQKGESINVIIEGLDWTYPA